MVFRLYEKDIPTIGMALKEEKYHKWYILPLTGPRDPNMYLIKMENMKYSGIIKNDLSAGEGVCVSFFVQGCPIHCPGCQNPETWDFDGGKEFTPLTMLEITDAISANGINRNFCVMGGEPLTTENQFLTLMVINEVKARFPDIKIYLWTGYTLEGLKTLTNYNRIKEILNLCDCIVEGPYVQELRDISLPMRGSSNQRVLYKKDFIDVI